MQKGMKEADRGLEPIRSFSSTHSQDRITLHGKVLGSK
jgi:hypothetical protein